MAYAITMDIPIDLATYQQIIAGLGPEPPEGLLVHLCVERAEGGLRYIDVWESRDAWERFQEERLHPVVHRILTAKLGSQPPEPTTVPLMMRDVWLGQALSARPLDAAAV